MEGLLKPRNPVLSLGLTVLVCVYVCVWVRRKEGREGKRKREWVREKRGMRERKKERVCFCNYFCFFPFFSWAPGTTVPTPLYQQRCQPHSLFISTKHNEIGVVTAGKIHRGWVCVCVCVCVCVTVPPLRMDVLLMTSQFSTVHNFYIRVKSQQLESYGWASQSPSNIETFGGCSRQVEGSSCPNPGFTFTDIPIGV